MSAITNRLSLSGEPSISKFLLPAGGERCEKARGVSGFSLSSMGWISGLLALTLLLGDGCATSTGTKTHLNENSLAKIKSLGVCAKIGSPFSVRVARDRISNVSGAVGGVVGYSIDKSLRASRDEEQVEKLQPLLSQFNCQSTTQAKFLEAFRRTGIFAEVQAINDVSPALTGGDGQLVVTLREWCLRPCLSGGKEEAKVEVCLDANCRILSASGHVLWDRSVEFRGGKCHTLEDYGATPGLLMQEFTQSLELLSNRMANEVRFPQ
jgi:hypothetical protein